MTPHSPITTPTTRFIDNFSEGIKVDASIIAISEVFAFKIDARLPVVDFWPTAINKNGRILFMIAIIIRFKIISFVILNCGLISNKKIRKNTAAIDTLR